MKYNRFEKFKILRHYDKLVECAKDQYPFPVSMVVYPSYDCNYHCPHCIMREERKTGGQLSRKTLMKLVDDCVCYGIETVTFSGGGEPLTNPHVEDTARLLREMGIKVALNTNGALLTDASNIDYLRISIDAGTAKTYKKIHGVDGFDHITEKLKTLKHNELGLAFLVQPSNIGEIFDFCDWAQQFDYSFLHIRPAYLDSPHLHGGDTMKLLIPSMDRIKDEVVKQYRNVHFKTDKFDGYWTQRMYHKCRSTPLIGVLCADGKFAVCQDNFIKFGDYNKQSLAEIWGSEEHQAAIAKIRLDECPRCVNNGHNEIIERCIINDDLRIGLI